MHCSEYLGGADKTLLLPPPRYQEWSQSQTGYSYPACATGSAVCLCVRIDDIVTGTLASPKRSLIEETEEDIPQIVIEEEPSDISILPRVILPPHPPTSPIPLPSNNCQISDIDKTPGSSARESVLRCPTSQGYRCSPSANTSPSFLLAGAGNTPGVALTWDNYRDSPTFSLSAGWSHPAGDTLWRELPAIRQSIASSTDPCLLDSESALFDGIVRLDSATDQLRKVQLVSTDISELEFEDLSISMDQVKATQLVKDHQRLQDEMDDLDPGSISRAEAPLVRDDVDRIWEMKNNFRDGVRGLVSRFQPDDELRQKWERWCKEMVDKVILHKRQVLAAIETLTPTEQMTEFQKKSLELQEKALTESRTVRKKQEEATQKSAWAEASVRLDTFREQYSILVGELAVDQTEVKVRDNVTISQNMQDLQQWKKTFEKISVNYREYLRIVTAHGEENPAEDEASSAKDEFEAVKKSFDDTREALEKVDRERELFSTHKSVGEKLDYPHFSGASSEDFIKFKDKMMKAFRNNGVAKSEQVEKLRKVLSGFALALVPESTATIEKAFETLKNAFGDPRKVLDDRMTKLRAVGDLPPERLGTDKPGFKKQEEWYLTIEGLLAEIIALGDREEDLAYHAFSEQTFNYILSLFPSDLADKLAEVAGTRGEQ